MITTALLVAALILALIDLIRERPDSLIGWAVVLVCVGLLWGRL